MKKIVSLFLAVAMVATLMVGCGKKTTETTTAAAAGQTTAAAGQKVKIGFSFPTKNNEFWVKAGKFVDQVASQLNIEVLAQDCNNQQEKQVNDVDNMISSGIQGLVLCPQDASVCPGILAKCKAKNIPVVIADRWPGDDLKAGTDYLAFIGPNDEQAGYDIAKALIEGGATKIAAIGGTSGTSVAENRKKGLEKAIAEYKSKGVQLVQYVAAGENMDQGDQAIRNILQAHPDVTGVWCYNDSLALASVNALKEKKMISKVKVGGIDLIDAAVKSIQSGEQYFSAGGHYMQAGFGMIMVYDKLNGKNPTQTKVQLNLLNITKANVDKYIAKYVNGMQTLDIKSMSQTYNANAKSYFEFTLD